MQKASRRPRGVKLTMPAVLYSLLPDTDVLDLSCVISCEDVLGHRGLKHTLPIDATLGALATTATYQDLQAFTAPW